MAAGAAADLRLEFLGAAQAREPHEPLVETASETIADEQAERLADQERLGASEQGRGRVICLENNAAQIRDQLSVRREVEKFLAPQLVSTIIRGLCGVIIGRRVSDWRRQRR